MGKGRKELDGRQGEKNDQEKMDGRRGALSTRLESFPDTFENKIVPKCLA